MQIHNFVPVIATELRERGARNILSIFYNEKDGNFSIFLKGDHAMGKKSFNYSPDMSLPLEKMCDEIIEVAERIDRGWLGYWIHRLFGL